MLLRRVPSRIRLEERGLTVAGIDPSTTETGFVILQKTATEARPRVLEEHRIRYPKEVRFDRYEAIVADVMAHLLATPPDVIVLEGYGLNLKNKSSIIPLIELGGILRRAIVRRYNRFLAPKPSQLKEFMTGSGQGKKERIYRAVLDHWGHRCQSEDTSDAFSCALMGLAHAGIVQGMSARQMEIVGSLCWE